MCLTATDVQFVYTLPPETQWDVLHKTKYWKLFVLVGQPVKLAVTVTLLICNQEMPGLSLGLAIYCPD